MTDILAAEFEKLMIVLRANFKERAIARLNAMIDDAAELVGQRHNQSLWDYRSRFYVNRHFLSRVYKTQGAIDSGVSSFRDPLVKVSDTLIEKIVEKEAELQASSAFDGFIAKNKAKMDGILKEVRQVKAVRSTINGIEGEFFVEVNDGSSFRMSFSIEYATSKNNVFFARFPTRFHDVTGPNGVQLFKHASEAKMKKEF